MSISLLCEAMGKVLKRWHTSKVETPKTSEESRESEQVIILRITLILIMPTLTAVKVATTQVIYYSKM